jgi:hypothetical protein
MSGMFALHCLSCHILFMPCILFKESFILSPVVSLVFLRNICSYLCCFSVYWFSTTKKKGGGGGKKMRNFIFSFGSFSDIACVFA